MTDQIILHIDVPNINVPLLQPTKLLNTNLIDKFQKKVLDKAKDKVQKEFNTIKEKILDTFKKKKPNLSNL